MNAARVDALATVVEAVHRPSDARAMPRGRTLAPRTSQAPRASRASRRSWAAALRPRPNCVAPSLASGLAATASVVRRTTLPPCAAAASPRNRPGEGCGPAAAARHDASHALPIGTLVGDLLISGLIGAGGFGIVYRAYDSALHRQVALKEYMPGALATRVPRSAEVSVRSPRELDTFNAGLRSFVNEARLLAQFDHPALVKVLQFWQANQTAYMVMPYCQGPTLKAHVAALAAAGQRPAEATLRSWLDVLLDALQALHAGQCLHRDIAPDNIVLTASGPVLLDFGAARRRVAAAAADADAACTVIVKPGYSPIEQYGEQTLAAQGPWTDLYALAGVIYHCITGRAPAPATARALDDLQPRLADVAAGGYSRSLLGAVDAALAVRPAERPQSVAEFRALLAAA